MDGFFLFKGVNIKMRKMKSTNLTTNADIIMGQDRNESDKLIIEY